MAYYGLLRHEKKVFLGLMEPKNTDPALQLAGVGVRYFEARSQNYEKPLSASSCLSLRPSIWNNSTTTGRIFMKFDMSILRKYVEKIQV